MKRLLFILLPLLFLLTAAKAQTIDDLRKLETLKKQLENTDGLPTVKKTVAPESADKSLTVFKDTLSKPIIPVQKKIVKRPIKPATLPYFGYDIFRNAKVDFSPEVFGPVDNDYPLGPGDEIIISLWGEVELRHTLTIDREGQVYIDNVGIVTLNGLNIKQAKKKLRKVLSKSYSSLSEGKAFLDLSIGKLRSIRVFVVGNVKSPGVFTVPALTSPFNMLFYAGGVLQNGSLRNISLVRKNKKVHTLDFYDFLNKGKKYANVRLQNYDVIVIPTIKKRVHLSGSVIKPAIYELSDQENLSDLIRFAGGFKANAYIENIQVERFINNKERQLLSVNYRDVQGAFKLLDGDRIAVSAIDRTIENFIKISGPVFGPKRFEFYPGMTIKDLFSQVDSIAGDAYLDRVHITRMLPDRTKQLFSLNLNEFLKNNDQDFLLAPEDYIEIQSRKALFPADSVHVYGAVTNPGTYELKKDMTLKDLIFSAGGFLKNAMIDQAEISRLDPFNNDPNKLSTILHVTIDSNYTKQLEPNTGDLFFLMANDDIFIRTNSDWEMQRHISIHGEVKRPGAYSLKSKTERITDLVERAGGLKPTAYLEGAQLFRSSRGVGQVGIDFKAIFEDPSDAQNIYLEAGDRIIIPERLATVKIVGGVHFPSSVLFEKGKGLDYYIKSAGGYTELADESNITVRLANGRPAHLKRFLLWKYLSDNITAGSTIYVPVFTENQDIDWSGAIRDAAAILSSVATVILIVDRVK